jgi:hypothetical protein
MSGEVLPESLCSPVNLMTFVHDYHRLCTAYRWSTGGWLCSPEFGVRMRIVLRQAPSPSARLFCGEAQTGTIPVSDQVDTLPLRRGVVRVSTDCLKVLVSHPEGRATIAALAALAVFSSVRMSVAMGWSDALPAAYAASAK